jgi:hypothetical protein
MKIVYVEQACLDGVTFPKKGSESENKKSSVQGTLYVYFSVEGIIHHEIVPENCTTLRRIIVSICLRVLGQASDPRVVTHPTYSPHLAPAGFFISGVKNCNEREEIRGCFIHAAESEDRTGGKYIRCVV